LGPHSYDPGISQSLLLWTTEVPEGSAKVDLDAGEAVLHFKNLSTVFDAFTVPNSFDTGHGMGFVGALIDSLRITWHGPGSPEVPPPAGASFSGTFMQVAKTTIELEVRTPATSPPFTPLPQDGFEFVADPATTVTNFAQIGHERNGSLK
jgi:hypothetical protein